MKLINKLKKKYSKIDKCMEWWLNKPGRSSRCPFGADACQDTGVYIYGCHPCREMFPELGLYNTCPCHVLGIRAVIERCKATLEGDI